MDVCCGGPSRELLLLPVWVAAFRFVDRSFSFVVNGRAAEVHGQRPWSVWKIVAATLAAVVALIVLAAFFLQSSSVGRAVRAAGPSINIL